jgi:hypothetical protein
VALFLRSRKMDLTAYNSHEEGRIERLGLVCATLRYQQPGCCDDIERLHDHKGTLSVFWRAYPTLERVELVNKIWRSLNEWHVEHHVVHDQLIAETRP